MAALAAKFQQDPNLTELGLGFANLPALANSWGVLYRAQFKFLTGPTPEKMHFPCRISESARIRAGRTPVRSVTTRPPGTRSRSRDQSQRANEP